MSISISFQNELFSLNKLNLPTRYYYFQQGENYIKLLSIGEGIFPKDRIKTDLKLENSNAIITTESATKVYPSKEKNSGVGINSININLINSNLEFINDELILFNESKFIQLLKIKADDKSTFFYGDILSHGRSFENFDFSLMSAKNSFYVDNSIEYLEKYALQGDRLKQYVIDVNSTKNLFVKIYIKLQDNGSFLKKINNLDICSFTYTSNKKMVIGVLSASNMSHVKKQLLKIWAIYRECLNKSRFDLGKQ